MGQATRGAARRGPCLQRGVRVRVEVVPPQVELLEQRRLAVSGLVRARARVRVRVLGLGLGLGYSG